MVMDINIKGPFTRNVCVLFQNQHQLQHCANGDASECLCIIFSICICITMDTIFNIDVDVDADTNANVTCEQNQTENEGTASGRQHHVWH